MDNKFWMNVLAVIVAFLLINIVIRPVLNNVLGMSLNEGFGGNGCFCAEQINGVCMKKLCS